MKTMYLALGYACNHRCLCCPITTFQHLHKPLDLKTITDNLDEAHVGSDTWVTLSGGEPTLHPQFFDVLAIMKQKKVYVSLLTNLSKFKDKSFIEQLITTIPKDHLHIVTALHHYQKDIHNHITNCPSSYDDTMHGLRNCCEYNLEVFIKIIIHKQNYQDLTNMVKFIIDKFPPNICIQFCVMDFEGNAKKNKEDFFIHYDFIKPELEKALDFFEKSKDNRKIYIIETPLCLCDPYYWKYYEIKKETLQYYQAPIVDNEEHLAMSDDTACGTNYQECDHCDVKQYCPGCWRSVYDLAKNLLHEIKGRREP